MSAHTPGPWTVCTDPPNRYWIAGRTIGAADPADARRICDVCDWPGGMAEANALLIAVAPELLAFVRELAFGKNATTRDLPPSIRRTAAALLAEATEAT